MMEYRDEQGRLRQCIIAGLSLLVMTPLLAACQGNEPTADETGAVETTPTPAPSQNPLVEAITPIGRSELLAAAAAAADEVAAGNPLPKANLKLTNRTFELRLPFGCSDGVSGRWGEWGVDPKTHVLRISVRPQLWGDDKTFGALAPDMTYDAAEGFWIERPWTRSEQCPTGERALSAPATAHADEEQPAALPPATPMSTLALVQYFSPDSSRTLRRGSRPYSYTTKVPETEAAASRNFRVKLIGRISGFDDGQPIHCVVTASFSPPTCAAAVEFTRVVLEDADTAESLSEWNS